MVSVSSRNIYQVGDQICAMIEESHAHIKIEGNNDIHMIFEFQIRDSSNEPINANPIDEF